MDQLTRTIKQLPQVLQNEIWEYVRGDRTYWKRQFKPIIHIVKYIHKQLRDDVEEFGEGHRAYLTVGIDSKYTDYVSLGHNGQGFWWVEYSGRSGAMAPGFGRVVEEFYRKIERMVVKHNF